MDFMKQFLGQGDEGSGDFENIWRAAKDAAEAGFDAIVEKIGKPEGDGGSFRQSMTLMVAVNVLRERVGEGARKFAADGHGDFLKEAWDKIEAVFAMTEAERQEAVKAVMKKLGD